MTHPTGLARTPVPPYYAVIFTSQRTVGDHGYRLVAERRADLGARYDGFPGLESGRGADGVGITVSYWRDERALLAWKRDTGHQKAKQSGQAAWYSAYEVRIAKVERAYGFAREAPS